MYNISENVTEIDNFAKFLYLTVSKSKDNLEENIDLFDNNLLLPLNKKIRKQ